MIINKKLEGDRIYLRTLTEQDATEKYRSWINNPEINKFLETKKTSIKELENYITTQNNDPNCLFLGIFLKENDTHIGNVRLSSIDFNKKSGSIGLLIGEKEYWGKGYGTETYKLFINYVFNNLNLKIITSGAYKENIGAHHIKKKVGFKLYKEEEDVLVYRLNKKDFFFFNQ